MSSTAQLKSLETGALCLELEQAQESFDTARRFLSHAETLLQRLQETND